MAFPASLTLVTLNIEFAVPPDGGAFGRLTFSIPEPLTGPTDDAVVPPVDLQATLDDGDGTASIALPATNDPQWTPSGWAYNVHAEVNNTSRRGTLQLDYQSVTAEFADLIQWEGAAVAGTTYATLAQAVDKTTVTTKGDLLVATAASTLARLGAGTTGQFLQADSATSTGLKWTTAGSGAVDSVAGRTGDVVLVATDVSDSTSTGRSVLTAATAAAARSAIGAGTSNISLSVKHATVASGSITPQSTGSWAAVTNTPTIAIAAAAGDYVTIDFLSFMYQPVGTTTFLDLAVLVSGSPVRYLSSGTDTPALEGSPSFYPTPSTYRGYGPVFGFQAASGDISGGNVTVGFATKGGGTGTIFADSNYPMGWRIMNYGAVSFS